MTRIAAVILAGGKGERMGGISKAEIDIGGRRLIDRVLDALSGCDPILVAAGPAAAAARGTRSIPDLRSDYGGPLAGLAAAVAALQEDDVDWLVSAAVDTPFFPANFLKRTIDVAPNHDVVIGCFGNQDYPTNALWRLSAIRDLPEQVRQGTASHSLRRLAAAMRSARLDYAEAMEDDPFANVNTPEDLMNLRARESRMRLG